MEFHFNFLRIQTIEKMKFVGKNYQIGKKQIDLRKTDILFLQYQ